MEYTVKTVKRLKTNCRLANKKIILTYVIFLLNNF